MLFEKHANATGDIFESMQKEKPITGGRMQFTDLINKSNAADLHPFDSDAALQAERN